LGWLSEFANSLSRSFSIERKLRPILVVLFLPFPAFSCQQFPAAELLPSIKSFCVGLVAAFDLAVDFRTSGQDVLERSILPELSL
jgi:hypothetical protein